MNEEALERIERLTALWRRERATSRARFEATQRADIPLKVRESRGVAARDLTIDDMSASGGHRLLLWIARRRAPYNLDRLRIGIGDPVRLTQSGVEVPPSVRGVVSRRRGDRIGVVVEDLPDGLSEGVIHLELDDDQATFERGQKALKIVRYGKRDDALRLRGLFFGDTAPQFRGDLPRHSFDTALNDPQRRAVATATAALDYAMIHGPPGTGKTRTLVEVVRVAVAAGETVLCCAASNTAVDNLAARLVDVGLGVVRLGHPARVDPILEAQTLDAWLEASPTWPLARKWLDEARALRRKLETRLARGNLGYDERRQMQAEAYRLTGDARKQLRAAQSLVLDNAQVVCTTAAGADTRVLGSRTFDLVVIDEATQAVDPIALVPILRGRRWVFAGDPCQLPPTVLDQSAERDGLGTTFFERLATRSPDAVRMLTVQYRMCDELMAYPSESMYHGKLVAADGVGERRLTDLEDVTDDAARPGPFIYIDTAGKGWDEERDEERSTCNPEQARRVASEVVRLVGRGVLPTMIAVISPYRAQVAVLRELLQVHASAGLEIDTIDAFQGREKEAVVVDLVRSNRSGDIGFLADVRRMNVALTRAKRFLLVIGDSATIGQHAYYAGFLDSVEVYGAWLSAWD